MTKKHVLDGVASYISIIYNPGYNVKELHFGK